MLMERTETLSCTKLLQLGSKHSDTSTRTLLIKEVLSWKSKPINAEKDRMLLPGKSTTVRIRDGSLSTMRTTEVTSRELEKIVTTDSSSMNHSMLSVRLTLN
jgi:hypothetical protein